MKKYKILIIRFDIIMRKVLMIIAQKGFRDEELFHTREELEKNDISIEIASETTDAAKGIKGGVVKPDLSIADIDVNNYDAIIFVGGIGASSYFDNKEIHKIIKNAMIKNKLLAAICIAPCILAKAGVLENKKATVFSIPLVRKYKNILRENGALFQKEKIVVDENIVTANGPSAAREFGRTISQMLKK